MKTKSNDPLQILLREAMHQQRTRVQVTLVQTSSLSQVTSTPPTRQCDRPQWKETRTVSLIHRSPQGRETFLGVFTEVQNDLLKARRLLPANKTAHGTLPKEVVTGDYWLHQQVPPSHEDTAQEVRAIEERFKELMKEWGSGC